jgi:Raf kinase inhibitor-like YbhB/YbcL family protein
LKGETMWLRSSAFADGTSIPRRFTCDGDDLSPPLEWGEAPAATRSFAVFCDDPDAPAGVWHHWAVYDIPARWTGLTERIQPDEAEVKQAINDSRDIGYGGPCPPRGHGRHRYHFRLLALSIGSLPPLTRPSCKTAEREARKHLVAEAVLIGHYERA